MNFDGLDRIAQIGIIVRNIEKSRTLWARLLGVEETPIIETERWESTHMTFRGKPSEGRARMTAFDLENISIELIQPVGPQSSWMDFLQKHGGGMHHVAFRVENLEEALEKLRKMGIEIEQKGEFKGGRYVYSYFRGEFGAVFELLHRSSKGKPP